MECKHPFQNECYNPAFKNEAKGFTIGDPSLPIPEFIPPKFHSCKHPYWLEASRILIEKLEINPPHFVKTVIGKKWHVTEYCPFCGENREFELDAQPEDTTGNPSQPLVDEAGRTTMPYPPPDLGSSECQQDGVLKGTLDSLLEELNVEEPDWATTFTADCTYNSEYRP